MKDFIYQNHPWLILSIVVFLSQFLGDQAMAQLQYQRLAISDNGFYRILTAHIVHANHLHSLINLAGLICLGLLSTYHMSAKDWWLGLLVSALFVSGGLFVFDPDLQWYRGLSGVLHGIAVLLVLKARQLAGFIRVIIFIAIAVKIVLEQMHTGLWQSEQLIGAPVVADAHLYGVVAGVVGFLILQQTRSKRMFRENF